MLDAAARLLSDASPSLTATIGDALREREALGSTAIGHGVALPYGRNEVFDEARAAFVRLRAPIAFGAMPIAFAETPPFARFGLGKGPALMLGMDALRSFRRVEIDFANRQIRFIVPEATTRPPRPARTAVADAGSPARAIP